MHPRIVSSLEQDRLEREYFEHYGRPPPPGMFERTGPYGKEADFDLRRRMDDRERMMHRDGRKDSSDIGVGAPPLDGHLNANRNKLSLKRTEIKISEPAPQVYQLTLIRNMTYVLCPVVHNKKSRKCNLFC